MPDIAWHGCRSNSPGWDDPQSRVLAFTIGAASDDDADLHVMMNMDWDDLDFDVPAIDGRSWYRAIDTGLPSPSDIAAPGGASRSTESDTYPVSGPKHRGPDLEASAAPEPNRS